MLEPNLRVVGIVLGDRLAERVVALLDSAVHRDPAEQVVIQAPVLLTPRVLSATYCERLIRQWEQDGSVDTGVARASGDVLDASYKRRRDHTIGDPQVLRELSSVIGRRMLPEVHKAFAFMRPASFDGR